MKHADTPPTQPSRLAHWADAASSWRAHLLRPYRGPAADKEVFLGYDLQAAKAAVAIVNSKRAVEPVQIALNRIERPVKTFQVHLDWFVTEIVSKLKSCCCSLKIDHLCSLKID